MNKANETKIKILSKLLAKVRPLSSRAWENNGFTIESGLVVKYPIKIFNMVNSTGAEKITIEFYINSDNSMIVCEMWLKDGHVIEYKTFVGGTWYESLIKCFKNMLIEEEGRITEIKKSLKEETLFSDWN